MTGLVIAIPSKGRLMDAAHDLFAEAGYRIKRAQGGRGYQARLDGADGVELRLLSASEIAGALGRGDVHLGLTGEDLIREAMPDAGERVHFVTPLGFGHADVVVAAPRAWIDVDTMDDLADVAARMRVTSGKRLRVATKYIALTHAFFAARGVADYRIVESQGATEGAPAAGSAEIIVDITSSGATLEANGLKVLEDGLILASQANLVASLKAKWDEEAREQVTDILTRLSARRTAKGLMELRAVVPGPAEVASDAERFDAVAPFGPPSNGNDPLVLHVAEGDAYALAAFLRQNGAGAIAAIKVEALFAPRTLMLDALLERVGAAKV